MVNLDFLLYFLRISFGTKTILPLLAAEEGRKAI